MGRKLYGWFSKSQIPHTGVLIYKTASGKHVKVTQATLSDSSARMPHDAIFLGELSEFVRRETKKTIDSGFETVEMRHKEHLGKKS